MGRLESDEKLARQQWCPRSLVARGVTEAVGIANHSPSPDCACSIPEAICVEIDPVFADDTCCAAVAIVVTDYGFLADHARCSTVSVAVSAYRSKRHTS